MKHWQIDFKDIRSVPGDPGGKRQHVVETLNIIDRGTSILLDAHVRSDFTAETALEALALMVCQKRLPWIAIPAGLAVQQVAIFQPL